MRRLRKVTRRPALGAAFGVSDSGLRIRNLTLLVAVGLGFLLRVYRIGSEGLWIDEAFSIWLARHPLGEMVGWVATVDQHPPLYYTVLRGWVRVFGDGEAAARMLSALFGTLTIPVVYLLGRRLADERVGAVSALILAVSPFHVRFSQEARMYAGLTLGASLALYAFLRLLEHREAGPVLHGVGCASRGPDGPAGSGERAVDRVWKRALPWIGYVFSTVVVLWTHNAAVLLPIALNLFVMVAYLSHRLSGSTRGGLWPTSWRREWVLAQGAILLLWLPWVPAFVSQAAGVYRRFWLPTPTVGSLLSIISVLLCDFLPLPLPAIVAVDGALVVLAFLGLQALRRRAGYAPLLGAVFLVPLMGEWFISLWRPILYARTLIWISIPLVLAVAAGVCRLGRMLSSRRASLLALVAVLAVNGAGVVNTYHSLEKEDWDQAAALVAGHAGPDDLLLFNDAWGQIPFDYYFRDLYNRPLTAHGVPVDLFDRGVLEPEMTEEDLPRLRALTRGRERIWLVYSHDWYTDPQGLVPLALEAEMTLLKRWEFEGIRVLLYGR